MTIRTVALTLAVVASSTLAAAQPQTPPKPTAVMRGRILLADGRPARRATVRLILQPSDPLPRVVSADASGRYEFTEVRDGEYRVSAGKPGYLAIEFGQRRLQEPGTIVSIKPGDVRDGINITLPGSGTISGTVTDENGDPVEGVTVSVLQPAFSGNRRQLSPVAHIGGRATDDQGHYRLYAVPPGQYVVSARPESAVLPDGYASTYFPTATSASNARGITIGVAQDLEHVDITLARAATARVTGMVVNAKGDPVRARVTMIPPARSGRSLGAEWISRVSDSDGRFEIAGVVPGEWVLQAVIIQAPAARPTEEDEFSSQVLSVTGDVGDIRVQLSAGSHVAGRVVFEGSGAADVTAVRIGTLTVDPDQAPFMIGVFALPNGVITGTPATAPASGNATAVAQLRPDGTFTLDGLNGPRRFRLAQAPSGWSVKAIRAGGRDVTDQPLPFGTTRDSLDNVEIVLTNRAGTITGNVTDGRGQAVGDGTVIVFATDPDRWYQGSRFLAATRVKSDGAYALPDLPPGDYYVAAIDWTQGDEWQDPNLLSTLTSRASRVLLGEGQSASVSARLIVR
jgi:hypothetical protein